jgi:hypothetical protein
MSVTTPTARELSITDRQFINRPNNETPMLLRYQREHGGTMILDYPPLVTRTRGAATRKVDAVLIDTPAMATRLGATSVYDWECATTRERETIDDMVETLATHVLQAKNSNLGPYLIGQAHFSRRLIGCAGGVAIAGPGSDALVRMAHTLPLTVVEDPEARSCSETRGLLQPDRARVQDFVDRVGGAQMPAEALRASSVQLTLRS